MLKRASRYYVMCLFKAGGHEYSTFEEFEAAFRELEKLYEQPSTRGVMDATRAIEQRISA